MATRLEYQHQMNRGGIGADALAQLEARGIKSPTNVVVIGGAVSGKKFKDMSARFKTFNENAQDYRDWINRLAQGMSRGPNFNAKKFDKFQEFLERNDSYLDGIGRTDIFYDEYAEVLGLFKAASRKISTMIEDAGKKSKLRAGTALTKNKAHGNPVGKDNGNNR